MTSWSPIGVLLASQSGAKYIQNGQLMTISPGSLMHSAEPKNIFSDFPEPLEGIPNRDSSEYVNVYGIPEARTVLRGTLRYKVRFNIKSVHDLARNLLLGYFFLFWYESEIVAIKH